MQPRLKDSERRAFAALSQAPADKLPRPPYPNPVEHHAGLSVLPNSWRRCPRLHLGPQTGPSWRSRDPFMSRSGH